MVFTEATIMDEDDIQWEAPLYPKQYGTLFLDVDSCVSGIEGIDELAGFKGKQDEVAALTRAAMNGEIALEEVFGRRLDMIQPTRADLEQIGQLYVTNVVPDAKEAVAAVQAIGVDVRLISGGYKDAIAPLAKHLGIPAHQVNANDLYFHPDGTYKGFNDANPLAAQGGKTKVVDMLKRRNTIHGLTAIVGDAVSELETKGSTDLQIGFAGVVARPAVVEQAPICIMAKTLAPVVPLILDRVGLDEIVGYHPSHRGVLERGFGILEQVQFGAHARRVEDFLYATRKAIPTADLDPNLPAREVWKGY